jgi:DNA polymerase
MDYCVQDVIVETAIREAISWFEIPAQEKEVWNLDQDINDRGVLSDAALVTGAINISAAYTETLTNEAVNITGLSNPNSAAQLKDWLSNATGTEVASLTKAAVPDLLANAEDDDVIRVLEIRQEMAKTSVKKYSSIQTMACADNRIRGIFQYCGANRTWRWAGRGVQPQNLPQNHLEDLELAREVVHQVDTDLLDMLYGNVPDTLSQLIRTALIAPAGSRLLVSDFSAIEARVIAWLAGERWRLQVFNTHGKIYEASASEMFKVPIDQITKGSPLRQKGKVAELALGYQGGPNALISMGALNMGIPEEELPKLVKMWRNANKKIVQLWYDVEEAAISALQGETITIQHNIRFRRERGMLCIDLPGGRTLRYQGAKLVGGKFGGSSIVYYGMNQTTKKWMRLDTYGGKLVENIVQAIARDCLAEAMIRVSKAGYKIVMHIHDEIVCEMPEGKGGIEEMNAIMSQPISWAKGLPLKADGYETTFYKKD